MSDKDDQTGVSRRIVFFIPGFDPMVPRRYRELYRQEAKTQAAISGYKIKTKANLEDPRFYSWQAALEDGGQETTAEIRFLVWHDIVSKTMDQSIFRSYLILVQTAWAYIGSGALWRLMRLPKGPMIAALYPTALLLLYLIVSVIVGGAIALAASVFLPNILALLLGLAVFVPAMIWFKRLDKPYYGYYLVHDYGYSAVFGGANPPELEARMQAFKEMIIAAQHEGADEVLVVGHSSGAHLAISILADILRDKAWDQNGPPLAFLSLGHVVPMVSFLPDAWRLRADLAYLATARHDITWVDVSAPSDGCTFALCDPVAVSGVAPQPQHWPLVISGAFSQTLSKAKQAELRGKYFRIHVQYVCAFDRPGDYDYFQITAGGQSLRARFENRAHSPSRIAKPVNKFTSTEP